jgi:hypothetical protein
MIEGEEVSGVLGGLHLLEEVCGVRGSPMVIGDGRLERRCLNQRRSLTAAIGD